MNVKTSILAGVLAMGFLFPQIAFTQQLTPIEQLGKKLFFATISQPSRMSCASCHAPDMGWTGPVAGINVHGGVYRGAVPQRFGNRKPPSTA